MHRQVRYEMAGLHEPFVTQKKDSLFIYIYVLPAIQGFTRMAYKVCSLSGLQVSSRGLRIYHSFCFA